MQTEGQPEDVANAIAFVCSERARYITGAVLTVTGGMDLFTTLLARLASPATVNGMVAFVTGLISSWSSTAGN